MLPAALRPPPDSSIKPRTRTTDSPSGGIRVDAQGSTLHVPVRSKPSPRGTLTARPAVALDPRFGLSQYHSSTWQIENGLPQNSAQVLLQTRDGYIWIGTQAGLARFDGVRFVVFDRANTAEMVRENIRALAEDSQGALWIGTDSGLLPLPPRHVHPLLARPTACSSDKVRSLLVDRGGLLWVGTERGRLSLVEDGRISSAGLPALAGTGRHPDAAGTGRVGPLRNPAGALPAARRQVEAVRRGARASRRSRTRGLLGEGRRNLGRDGQRRGPARGQPVRAARICRPASPAIRSTQSGKTRRAACGWGSSAGASCGSTGAGSRSTARPRAFPATTSWRSGGPAGEPLGRQLRRRSHLPARDAVLGVRAARGAADRRRAEHLPGARRGHLDWDERWGRDTPGGGRLTTFGRSTAWQTTPSSPSPRTRCPADGVGRHDARPESDRRPDRGNDSSHRADARGGRESLRRGAGRNTLDWHRPGGPVGHAGPALCGRLRPRATRGRSVRRCSRSGRGLDCAAARAWRTSRTVARRPTPAPMAWATTTSCRSTATATARSGRARSGAESAASRTANRDGDGPRGPIRQRRVHDPRGRPRRLLDVVQPRHLPGAEAELERSSTGRRRVRSQAYGMADGLRGSEGNGGSQPAAWKIDDGRLWFARIRGAVIVDPSAMRAGRSGRRARARGSRPPAGGCRSGRSTCRPARGTWRSSTPRSTTTRRAASSSATGSSRSIRTGRTRASGGWRTTRTCRRAATYSRWRAQPDGEWRARRRPDVRHRLRPHYYEATWFWCCARSSSLAGDRRLRPARARHEGAGADAGAARGRADAELRAEIEARRQAAGRLEREIVEREQVQEELARAKERAEAANQAKGSSWRT